MLGVQGGAGGCIRGWGVPEPQKLPAPRVCHVLFVAVISFLQWQEACTGEGSVEGGMELK